MQRETSDCSLNCMSSLRSPSKPQALAQHSSPRRDVLRQYAIESKQKINESKKKKVLAFPVIRAHASSIAFPVSLEVKVYKCSHVCTSCTHKRTCTGGSTPSQHQRQQESAQQRGKLGACKRATGHIQALPWGLPSALRGASLASGGRGGDGGGALLCAGERGAGNPGGLAN